MNSTSQRNKYYISEKAGYSFHIFLNLFWVIIINTTAHIMTNIFGGIELNPVANLLGLNGFFIAFKVLGYTVMVFIFYKFIKKGYYKGMYAISICGVFIAVIDLINNIAVFLW